MPLLAYCTIQIDPEVHIPLQGVQAQPVFSVQHSGLQCLVSSFAASLPAGGEPIRDSALVFNEVLQSVLRQSALIPFRFPTMVEDEHEVSRYLQDHESKIAADLVRFRGMVQMEIQAQLWTGQDAVRLQSGKDYLRSKQRHLANIEKALSTLRLALGPYAREWRVRESADRARCYALISSSSVDIFREAARTIEIPDSVRARITGPWPVSEFLTEQ